MHLKTHDLVGLGIELEAQSSCRNDIGPIVINFEDVIDFLCFGRHCGLQVEDDALITNTNSRPNTPIYQRTIEKMTFANAGVYLSSQLHVQAIKTHKR